MPDSLNTPTAVYARGVVDLDKEFQSADALRIQLAEVTPLTDPIYLAAVAMVTLKRHLLAAAVNLLTQEARLFGQDDDVIVDYAYDHIRTTGIKAVK